MTGRMLDERLGKWNFWIVFIGFNLAFLPMHLTGLARHAAAHLHLSARHGLGRPEPASRTRRRLRARHRRSSVLINVVREPSAWCRRRAPTRGTRTDPGMVDPFATAAVQFRRHPARREPASAVGRADCRKPTARSSLDAGMVLDHGRETIGTSPLDGEPDDDPAGCRRTPIAPFLLDARRIRRSSSGFCCICGGWPLVGVLSLSRSRF